MSLHTEKSRREFARAKSSVPRRREFSRPRLPGRRRRPPVHRPGREGAPLRRGRQRVPRLRALLGPAARRATRTRRSSPPSSRPRRWGRASARPPRARHAGREGRALVPSMKKLRFVSSRDGGDPGGVRVARGFTGRERIVKFQGCFHGATDSLLVHAGSGVETLGLPDSPAFPRRSPRSPPSLPLQRRRRGARVLPRPAGRETAAAIVEPVVGNMGVLVPRPGFLETLLARDEARRRALHLRRGDDRLPRRPRRGAGALRDRARTSPASAR